jgi:ubiquinone biosynthesis protein
MVKYGFTKIVKRIGLINLVAMKPVKVQVEGDDPVRVRKMLEELGPTYVKIGQVLSMRPDLLPPEYIKELSNLYDSADPFEFDLVKAQLESELGNKISKIFLSFEETPIAAGSIGQVHRAVLKDGTKVVVKIQRLGIEDTINTDLDIVYKLANLAEKNIPSFRTFQPVEVVHELDRMLHNEMNYTVEAKNGIQMYKNFEKVDWVKIPKIYEEYSTRKILVMEYIKGHRLAREGFKVKGIDNKKLSKNIARAMMKQMFIDGFFQADPSLGNIIVIDENNIAFIDFGAVGKISTRRRQMLIEMLIAVAGHDAETVTDLILEMGEVGKDFNKKDLVRDVQDVLDYYYTEKPSVYDETIANNIIELSRKYDVRLPADFTLLERALYETESTCRSLDPNFDLLASSGPIIKDLVAERFSPDKELKELFQTFQKYYKVFKFLPGRVDKILKKLEDGELKVKMDVKGATHLETRLTQMMKRIEISLVICALILATTLIYMSDKSMGTGMFVFILIIILFTWIMVNFFMNTRDK